MNRKAFENKSLGIPEKRNWVAALGNIPPRRLVLKGPFMLCLVESVATLSGLICVCQQQILAKLASQPGSTFAYPGLLERPFLWRLRPESPSAFKSLTLGCELPGNQENLTVLLAFPLSMIGNVFDKYIYDITFRKAKIMSGVSSRS